MREKSLSNVNFVTKFFFLNDNVNQTFLSVHEQKKRYKCHFCHKIFSLSIDFYKNDLSICEGKKPVGHPYLYNKKEAKTLAIQHSIY